MTQTEISMNYCVEAAVRRGLIVRLPLMDSQVRACRRAPLRKAIKTAQNQLSKLPPATAAE